MSKVSITRCSSYDKNAVLRAVTDALELLGGVETFVRRSERILVKPNLLSGKPPEAAVTTHPAQYSSSSKRLALRRSWGTALASARPGALPINAGSCPSATTSGSR